jgi:drug/metabolite transporter (DMT)-like permease
MLFNWAVVLQALEARRVTAEHGLRLSLLGQLARRPRWLGGIVLSAAAVAAQILALTLAPLTVVQSADAAGLVLLLAIGSRVLGEHVGRRELTAVLGIVFGIVAIVAARPAHSTTHADATGLVAGLLVTGALAAAPYVLRRQAGAHGLIVVLGAGFAFAAAAFSIKLVADSLASGTWPMLGLAAGVAATAGIAGTLSEQSALQHRQVTQVAPIIFVTELTVPLVLAITIGGESWGDRPLRVGAISGGLALLTTSVIALLRGPAVSGLIGASLREASARPAGRGDEDEHQRGVKRFEVVREERRHALTELYDSYAGASSLEQGCHLVKVDADRRVRPPWTRPSDAVHRLKRAMSSCRRSSLRIEERSEHRPRREQSWNGSSSSS